MGLARHAGTLQTLLHLPFAFQLVHLVALFDTGLVFLWTIWCSSGFLSGSLCYFQHQKNLWYFAQDDPKRPASLEGWWLSLRTLMSMVASQATGVPTGNHGLFHRWVLSEHSSRIRRLLQMAVTLTDFGNGLKNNAFVQMFHLTLEGQCLSLSNVYWNISNLSY